MVKVTRKEQIYDIKVIGGARFQLYMIRSSKELCKLVSFTLKREGKKVRILKLKGINRWGIYIR